MTIEGIEHHIQLCCELQEKEGWILMISRYQPHCCRLRVPLHTPYYIHPEGRKEGRKEDRSKQVLLDTPFSF